MERRIGMLLAVGLLLQVGCGGESDPPCADLDGDGFGAACAAGADCDDADPNNWDACATCLDGDSDGSFAGCNRFQSITGPDCDDADVDNQTSCASCVDTDSDNNFVGCDQYLTRLGPDCDDSESWTGFGVAYNDDPNACMTDADYDGWGDSTAPPGGTAGTDCDDTDGRISPDAAENDSVVGCAADFDGDGYGAMTAPPGGVAGNDCDDADTNNFASCASCADADEDLSYASCDAYVTISGPDCDDADPVRGTANPEYADDGVDNDCSGRDLVAATASGIHVDDSNTSCTDFGGDAGTVATPYCSLSAAIAPLIAGTDIFVASGTHVLRDVVASIGIGTALRIHGGYDGSWTRNLATNLTRIETDPLASTHGLSFTGSALLVDGIHWDRPGTNNVIDLKVLAVDQTAITRGSFTKPDVDGLTLDLRGGYNLSFTRAHALIRDIRFQGGGSQIAGSHGFLTFRLEDSAFDIIGSSGFVLGLRTTAYTDYILNNTFYMEEQSNLIVGGFEASTAYVVGNSVESDTVPGGNLFQIGAGRTLFANNAMRTLNSGTAGLFGSGSASAVMAIDVLSNLLTSSPLSYLAIFGPGVSFYPANAAAMNGCTVCASASGNLNDNAGFLDPSLGDFRLGASSPGIDAGVDPRPLVPYFRVGQDRDGVPRPRDGDGIGGAEFDIGAIEN